MRRKCVAYIVNVDWFFISHRLPLALAAQARGWDIHIFTTDTGQAGELEKKGFHIHRVPLGRAMQNPFLELTCFFSILSGLNSFKPDVVHCVAFKAVILGGLAARFCRIPRIVLAVTGFGSTFLGDGLKSKLWKKAVFALLRFICSAKATRVILQNEDDRREFLQQGILHPEQIALIRGSGVSVDEYIPAPEPGMEEGFVCLLPARLLKDKGVCEFVEAARILKSTESGVKWRMVLAGGVDLDNKTSITKEQMDSWVGAGLVEWRDHCRDMIPLYRMSHVVVLPSYREGLPKVLIEAGACGRASIATDVPGCREIIQEGVNGLVVPVKNAAALAAAIIRLQRDHQGRQMMGQKAREIIVSGYDVRDVIDKTLFLY